MLHAGPVRVVSVSLALALLSAGCAQVSRHPLLEEHRKAITSSKTIGNVSQQEIATSIERSTAGFAIGGLIGAIVDSAVENHRASKAESGAAALRDLLTDYDPRPAARSALEKELAGTSMFQGTRVELAQEPKLDKTTVTAMVDAAGTDALLVVDFDYRLSPSYDHIVVTAVATLLPTRAAASPVLKQVASTSDQLLPSPLLYHGIFFSSCPAPLEGAGMERWTSDKGAAARIAIEGGIAEVVRMLVWDLDQPGPKGALYEANGATAQVMKQFGPRQWYLLDVKDGRSWYRSPTGELASSGEAYPGLEVVPAAVEAKAEPVPRVAAVPPTLDPLGGITFEFATADFTRQGGAVNVTKYSERDGDVTLKGKAVADGVLTVHGQVGLGQGSTWAGLGPNWDLQADSRPLDASKFKFVTFRIAASTRSVRLRLVGAERETQRNGCYPVYVLEVNDQMKEYNIPISKFEPERWCGSRGRDPRETLPRLTGFEVVSTNVSQLPLTLSIGRTTLIP